MTPASPEAEAFARALFATGRASFARFVAFRGLSLLDPTSKAHARELFDATTPLFDDDLVRLCRSVLPDSTGSPVFATTLTVWEHLRRTAGGEAFTYLWPQFAAQHAAWGQLIEPKGEGRIFSPMLTDNGERLTAHTRSIHLLVLDCDGTGTWNALWSVLVDLGFAAITHESGGCTPTTPKWRLLIPLSSPFDTTTEGGIAAWRAAYAYARVVFGALGQLRGVGFDPATDLANNAWFPGYRRSAEATPRTVLFTNGYTLNLGRLVSLLPPPTRAPVELVRRSWVGNSPSLLELAFEEAGLLGRAMERGRSAVVCPWNDCHTAPLSGTVEPTSATILFPPNSAANVGSFYCAHSSCGSRSLADVLDGLPIDALHRARLRHVRGDDTSASWPGRLELPRLPTLLPRRLPVRLS